MSFRARLLLFFMIIVVVPMVAVALVLFCSRRTARPARPTRRSPRGCAPRSPSTRRRADARASLARGSPATRGSASRSRDGRRPRSRARVRALARRHGVDAIAVYDPNGRRLAFAGDPTAIAPAVARPSTAAAERLGSVAVSTTDARRVRAAAWRA